MFEQSNTTPDRQRIREITIQLAEHGPISETNVYNWFQNRRARSKRKQAALPPIPNHHDSAKDKETKPDETQVDENLAIMLNHMYFQSPDIGGKCLLKISTCFLGFIRYLNDTPMFLKWPLCLYLQGLIS